MGSIFDTWNDVVANGGAYYVGAAPGHTAEWVWVLLSIACCLCALYVGHKHETDAYDKAGQDNVDP